MRRKGRRLARAPQECRLIPDDGQQVRRELERQFRAFVKLEDEAGYWRWLSLQPGFNPDCPLSRQRAADAWREAIAEK
jgi:hypothetical protein